MLLQTAKIDAGCGFPHAPSFAIMVKLFTHLFFLDSRLKYPSFRPLKKQPSQKCSTFVNMTE
jgi:hypothetical protein